MITSSNNTQKIPRKASYNNVQGTQASFKGGNDKSSGKQFKRDRKAMRAFKRSYAELES